MKTTLDIADGLLEEAKLRAADRGQTLRAFVEDALRQALDQPPRRPFCLEDFSYGTRGMAPEFAGRWDAIRDEIYRGRGA